MRNVFRNVELTIDAAYPTDVVVPANVQPALNATTPFVLKPVPLLARAGALNAEPSAVKFAVPAMTMNAAIMDAASVLPFVVPVAVAKKMAVVEFASAKIAETAL